jgi:hypothetical protein
MIDRRFVAVSLVDPIQVEYRIDLSHQMISKHHLVEIKRVKEYAAITQPASD